MHIPGVKQEQPDRRPAITAPLTADAIIRDGENTRVAKLNGEDPRQVIRILNTLVRKMEGPLYVDATVRDGGNKRILKMTGEDDTRKVIRVLGSLIRKANRIPMNGNSPVMEEVTDNDDIEVVPV